MFLFPPGMTVNIFAAHLPPKWWGNEDNYHKIYFKIIKLPILAYLMPCIFTFTHVTDLGISPIIFQVAKSFSPLEKFPLKL